jgi:K+-sensing histidine kinase KdpD
MTANGNGHARGPENDFINLAGHELNTPLTSVRLQIHLIRSGRLGPVTHEQEASLEILERNASRLAGVVGDLVELNRIRCGGRVVESVACDLVPLLAQALRLDSRTLPPPSGGVASVWVKADPRLLQDALARLHAALPTVADVEIRMAQGTVDVAVSCPTWRSADDLELGAFFAPFGIESANRFHGSFPSRLDLAIAHDLIVLQGGRLAVEPGREAGGILLRIRLAAASDLARGRVADRSVSKA